MSGERFPIAAPFSLHHKRVCVDELRTPLILFTHPASLTQTFSKPSTLSSLLQLWPSELNRSMLHGGPVPRGETTSPFPHTTIGRLFLDGGHSVHASTGPCFGRFHSTTDGMKPDYPIPSCTAQVTEEKGKQSEGNGLCNMPGFGHSTNLAHGVRRFHFIFSHLKFIQYDTIH
eukprot:766574-Hanusia_phi.AAC.3